VYFSLARIADELKTMTKPNDIKLRVVKKRGLSNP
jgi:hypothetical protein